MYICEGKQNKVFYVNLSFIYEKVVLENMKYKIGYVNVFYIKFWIEYVRRY